MENNMEWSEQDRHYRVQDSEYLPAGWFKESSDEDIVNSCKPTHWMPNPTHQATRSDYVFS
jgi:hypothetical protein